MAIRRLFFLSILLLFGGCQSMPVVKQLVTPDELLHDRAFPHYQSFQIETEKQVFSLSHEAKVFVNKSVRLEDDLTQKMESLVHRIFDYSQLDLLYLASANTVASDTFENRAANCLSMSIMTYAMAEYAGFDARFQEIDIPEYWTRRDGYSLLNGHINLQIFPRSDGGLIHMYKNGYQVDFDPQGTRKHFPKHFVSRQQVLAMFYNNKGADALLIQDYERAYAYFRAAITAYPEFDSVWVNLGLLYRYRGFYHIAEESYRYAIQLDSENLTAWENLAYLYQRMGNVKDANAIIATVHSRRVDNPYYHFILGEQALDEQALDEALSHYRNALRLDDSKHEVYFGLAKVYYQLGDISRSQRYFKLAKRNASSHQQQQKYQGKLDLLSSNQSY